MVEDEIAPSVEDLGYDVVQVLVLGNEKKIIRVAIERKDGEPITLKDCEDVGYTVSVCLDVLDPLVESYDLEVSSPGIDRPLVKPRDFVKFCGRFVVIKARKDGGGRKTYKGLLESASESGIRLEDLQLPDCDDSIELSYEEIESACIDGLKR
jgi:ribosome maturation factor RimP